MEEQVRKPRARKAISDLAILNKSIEDQKFTLELCNKCTGADVMEFTYKPFKTLMAEQEFIRYVVGFVEDEMSNVYYPELLNLGFNVGVLKYLCEYEVKPTDKDIMLTAQYAEFNIYDDRNIYLGGLYDKCRALMDYRIECKHSTALLDAAQQQLSESVADVVKLLGHDESEEQGVIETDEL